MNLPMDTFYVSAGVDHIKREREKARELKKTRWWQELLNKGLCYYCDKTCVREELTMDHKVPLARGGSSSRNNIVACCKSCNSQKKSRTAAELEIEKITF